MQRTERSTAIATALNNTTVVAVAVGGDKRQNAQRLAGAFVDRGLVELVERGYLTGLALSLIHI